MHVKKVSSALRHHVSHFDNTLTLNLQKKNPLCHDSQTSYRCNSVKATPKITLSHTLITDNTWWSSFNLLWLVKATGCTSGDACVIAKKKRSVFSYWVSRKTWIKCGERKTDRRAESLLISRIKSERKIGGHFFCVGEQEATAASLVISRLCLAMQEQLNN